MFPTTHTTASGFELDLSGATDAQREFLQNLQNASRQTNWTRDQMIAFAYGTGNPILERGRFPGSGMVSAQTLELPAYRAMCDLMYLHELKLAGQTTAQAAEAFTLTVPEVAAMLDITPDAVRKAINDRRLAAWRKGGQWYVLPLAVESFQRSTRGPDPLPLGEPLHITMGSEPGASMRCKLPQPLEDTSERGRVITGTLSNWRRIAVFTTEELPNGKSARMFVLEPAETGSQPGEFTFRAFGIKGAYRIASKINDAARAAAAWKVFRAA